MSFESFVRSEYVAIALYFIKVVFYVLSNYVPKRFIEDPQPRGRQEMCNLVSMIYLMYPSIKLNLGITHRCLSSWQRIKRPTSAASLTFELCLAFSMDMLLQNCSDMAVVLLLSFSGFVRASEALKIKWDDVVFPGDQRVDSYGPNIAGANNGDAKTTRHTGPIQFVKFKEKETIQLLALLRKLRPNDVYVARHISYPAYDACIKRACVKRGVSAKFPTQSARVGKATQEYMRGSPAEQIAINGKW